MRGGLQKFLDTRKGDSGKIRGRGVGSKNLYTSKPTGRGGSCKIELLVRGVAKISSFEFQYLHPPLVILNELSLYVTEDCRA